MNDFSIFYFQKRFLLFENYALFKGNKDARLIVNLGFF